MQFRFDGEVFDTQQMVCIEVDSVFLNIYLLPSRGLVFLQTFDEDRGVTIRKATTDQTVMLLELLGRTRMPTVPDCCEVINRILAPEQRRVVMRAGRGVVESSQPMLLRKCG